MRLVSTWAGKALPLAGGTMTGDIAMGDNKVTGLGEPDTQDDALRKARAEILNADINDDACIAITKLDLALAIANAHIAINAAIVESKLDLDQGTQALYDKIATDITTHAGLFTELHGVTIVRKPDDQIVSNSVTLVNDEDLVIAVGANEVWIGYMVLLDTSPTSTPKIDIVFAVPSGGAVKGFSTPDNLPSGCLPVDLTAELALTVGAKERNHIIPFIYVGGGNAGNLQLQWAQHSVMAENTTMKANSFMLCRRGE